LYAPTKWQTDMPVPLVGTLSTKASQLYYQLLKAGEVDESDGGEGQFRPAENWNPLYIIVQIVATQACFYSSWLALLFLMRRITARDAGVSLDDFIDPTRTVNDSRAMFIFLLNSLIRYFLVLDFW
jgi:hypothetical protein